MSAKAANRGSEIINQAVSDRNRRCKGHTRSQRRGAAGPLGLVIDLSGPIRYINPRRPASCTATFRSAAGRSLAQARPTPRAQPHRSRSGKRGDKAMGLFDQMLGGVLGNVLGQAGNSGALGGLLNSALNGPMGQALPGMLNSALANTSFGNLEGLLAQLQQSGLGDQVASWLSNGPNAAVSAEQITAALGDTQLGQITAALADTQLGQLAASFGLSAETLPSLLSQYLPTVIDKLSPNGVLEMPSA
ncbi:YidB family protein [Xanthobacter sp. AM11]|uniref:YidB family protein n=1 Tax=Xanthobacter sp. AM11 TaxID=3380643 RepID=UPI0039BF692C